MSSCYKLKLLIPALLLLTLGGCMGGPIAQQLASSIIMRAADKAVSNSIENSLRAQEEAERQKPLPDKLPDEYWAAFLTAGFAEMAPIEEPLPQLAVQASPTPSTQVVTESRLVRVELWNVMLGDEKQSVLEKARLMGSTTLPPKTEWPRWKVAIGAIANHQQEKPLVFLIPPDFGKVSSGQHAVVEMTGLGELHVARYPVN